MLHVAQIGSVFVIALLTEKNISLSIKEIAIYAQLGTVKLSNKLASFGGKRMGNTFVFDNKENAELTLDWIESIQVSNKIAGIKRPTYGY